MGHKAEGRAKQQGWFAVKCRNYSKSWSQGSPWPGGSYTSIAWLGAWHRALSLPQLSTSSWTAFEFLSCASLGLHTWDVSGLSL